MKSEGKGRPWNLGTPGRIQDFFRRLVLDVISPRLFSTVALATAFSYFFWVFDLSFITDGNFWRYGHGDQGQAFVGFLHYVNDDWRLPLFHTDNLGYPHGANLIFTDSIPLAALVFKILRPILPTSLHPFGLWLLLCHLLLAHALASLLYHFGVRNFAGAVSAALFAVATPFFMSRLGHEALCAQFLIVYALLLYFKLADGPHRCFFSGPFTVLLVSSLLVHVYIFVMVAVIYGCSVLNLLSRSSIPRGTIGKNIGTTILIVGAVAFLAGHFAEFSSLVPISGFGQYSMNLLGPFILGYEYQGFRYWPVGLFLLLAASGRMLIEENPRRLTLPKVTAVLSLLFFIAVALLNQMHFFRPPDGTGRQYYEGFVYWGEGFILLFCSTVPILVADARLLLSKRFMPLTLGLITLTLFAVANRVYLSHRLLFSYDLPNSLLLLVSQFRSTGRFFWGVSYALMALVIVRAWRSSPAWIGRSLVLGAALLQLAEMGPMRGDLRYANHASEPQALTEALWHPIVGAHQSVVLVPPAQCGGFRNIYAEVGRITAEAGVPLLSVVAARYGKSATQSCRATLLDLAKGRFEPGALYIVDSGTLLSLQQRSGQAAQCGQLELLNICSSQGESIGLGALSEGEPALWPSEKKVLKANEMANFLGIGWSGIEEQGVWSLGYQSEVIVRLPGCFPGRRLRFKIEPFVGSEGQTITLSVNGETPLSRVYEKPATDDIVVQVGPCNPHNPKAVTRFLVSSPLSPLEHGTSEDVRPLGFRLIEAELLESGEIERRATGF